ncbi:MAG: N-acetylmuramoyl-L-alanine amidase [Chloroflexaceae bacterium]|nr:N-acetylmuramoyl-L-alanine amidase [Chloroflexaceae bacterium]
MLPCPPLRWLALVWLLCLLPLAPLAVLAVPVAAESRQSAPAAPADADPEFVYVPRVGIQVGHWNQDQLPSEQARIRRDTGAYREGVSEWELNYMVAEQAKPILEAAGVQVDLLPATIPPGYRADAFVSLHFDGVDPPIADLRRGWKVTTPYLASPKSLLLEQAFREVYPTVTGLPYDEKHGSLANMRANYTFAWYRFEHAIAPETPAALIELAFSTNPADWALITEQPELLAEGLAQSILRYLEQFDPYQTLNRRPPYYPLYTPREPMSLYDWPNYQSAGIEQITPDNRLLVMREQDGWYLVFVRGTWDLGWIPAEALQRIPNYHRNR